MDQCDCTAYCGDDIKAIKNHIRRPCNQYLKRHSKYKVHITESDEVIEQPTEMAALRYANQLNLMEAQMPTGTNKIAWVTRVED